MNVVQDSRAQIQALTALLSMADIAVGEAALVLADQMDAKVAAEATALAEQDALQALHRMHGRLSEPGQTLQPALMNQIANQVVTVVSAVREAERRCQSIDAQIDKQRSVLQALQGRHDLLHDLHRQARDLYRAEQERREAFARDELYLAYRWAHQGRTWM